MQTQHSNTQQSHIARAKALQAWLQQNREEMKQYQGEYIAFNESGLIAHHHDYAKLIAQAETKGEQFIIDVIRSNPDAVYIMPITIRSISQHQWLPKYPVILHHGAHTRSALMLVDSGADFSVMPLTIGKELGYTASEDEMTFYAGTVAGTVPYLVRKIQMTIDEYTFTAPIIWLQTEGTNELILGREFVFDTFDIEFKQADEVIVFTLRPNFRKA